MAGTATFSSRRASCCWRRLTVPSTHAGRIVSLPWKNDVGGHGSRAGDDMRPAHRSNPFTKPNPLPVSRRDRGTVQGQHVAAITRGPLLILRSLGYSAPSLRRHRMQQRMMPKRLP